MRARDYIFSLEQIGIKLGLEQIRALLDELGHPERAYQSIVIAGTNGKGSVTAMVDRALRAAGYRAGRYTSPHLTDLEERMVIEGEPIAATELDRVAERIREAARTLPSPPSFFEATTALALEAFRHAHVNVGVLEVGLGGRLDATNAVDSIGVAITSIDFDHEAYLGDTLEAIATEKAGVIKPGGFVVLAENPGIVQQVVSRIAMERGASYSYVPDEVQVDGMMAEGAMTLNIRSPRAVYPGVRLALRGRHQAANAATAVALLERLHAGGRLRIPESAIRTGLEDVVWPGRLELRRVGHGDILIDGAHNPAGARALARYLEEAYARPLPFVVGVMRDKHVTDIVRALAPAASVFVATAVDSPRAATPAEIAAAAREAAPDVSCVTCVPPADAVALAATRGNPVVVAGSLYLAGEVRSKLSS